MLDIEIEMKKGIMFVRINGELTASTISKWNDEVKNLIVDNGIRNVVFNVFQLKSIDMKGINSLLYSYEICKSNKGKTCICGLNGLIKSQFRKYRLLKYITEIESERDAISFINV